MLRTKGVIWKPIQEYGGFYEISNYGQIRTYHHKNGTHTLTKPREKVCRFDKDGYARIMLYGLKQGLKPVNKSVGRLVLETFIGPCPLGMESSHLDGDNKKDRLSNLRWETHAKNERRKRWHKTKHIGESRADFKLKKEDILKIRKLYTDRTHFIKSQNELSVIYNVPPGTIYYVIHNQMWR